MRERGPIKGEKKAAREEKDDERHYMERRYGSFARSLQLSFEAKDADVDASFENGVLTLRIPKRADIQKSVREIALKKK